MSCDTHSKMLTHCWRWLCQILSGAPRPRIQLWQRCLSPYQPLCLSFKDIRNTIQIVDLGTIAVLTNNKDVTNRHFLGKSGNYWSRLPDEKTMASWTRLSNQLINLMKLLFSSKIKIERSHKLHWVTWCHYKRFLPVNFKTLPASVVNWWNSVRELCFSVQPTNLLVPCFPSRSVTWTCCPTLRSSIRIVSPLAKETKDDLA